MSFLSTTLLVRHTYHVSKLPELHFSTFSQPFFSVVQKKGGRLSLGEGHAINHKRSPHAALASAQASLTTVDCRGPPAVVRCGLGGQRF